MRIRREAGKTAAGERLEAGQRRAATTESRAALLRNSVLGALAQSVAGVYIPDCFPLCAGVAEWT